ncbi:hypothetical protein KSF_108920 [Reticulibacter mediterranei]|uniref:Uncharacterized protein n=1 Tax=Reticulibacter mediterranei TaxID=2778369 RepID=A0A8J3IRR9_9CHLR|nr:hypothetical protein [Reticulibacter mediterranei]GHP00845.1 hypothetical protein KSF_108920 [Reticulibacter mediterranei]
MPTSQSQQPVEQSSRQLDVFVMNASDEKARRQAALIVGRLVHIITTYYGPDLLFHTGTLVDIDLHSPFPYHVAVENVPGFDLPVVRSFEWYEIDLIGH